MRNSCDAGVTNSLVYNLYGDPDVPEWGTETMTKLFDKIQTERLIVTPSMLNVSETAADFLKRLLVKDMNARPSFRSCLEHEFLKKVSSKDQRDSGAIAEYVCVEHVTSPSKLLIDF